MSQKETNPTDIMEFSHVSSRSLRANPLTRVVATLKAVWGGKPSRSPRPSGTNRHASGIYRLDRNRALRGWGILNTFGLLFSASALNKSILFNPLRLA